MNLYDRLLALQEIPDAYACWSAYRKALTEYIIKQIDKPQRVLVLGVGRGNDLALDKLLHYTISLTLWDKDKGGYSRSFGAIWPIWKSKDKCDREGLIRS